MISELGEDLVPVFAIGCACAFLVIWVLCATAESLHKTHRQMRLKEKLVERGFTAAEIASIVGSDNAETWDGEPENVPVPPVKNSDVRARQLTG